MPSPAWFDPDGVSLGDDWHYRVSLEITSGQTGDTVVQTINYADILSALGITGTYDVKAVRVVRPNGTSLVVQQNFTDLGLSGEIEFVLEDDAPETYYVYFDITENAGVSKPLVSSTINAEWFDENWSYRLPVTIDNSLNANVLTEYQVQVELDASFVDFWTHVDPSGNDMRFVQEDGVEADFFVESFDYGAQQAFIWVQVPGPVPAYDITTVYLYYGNVSASDASDELATFSYAAPQPVHYVLHSNVSSLSVVSYADANTIVLSASTNCSSVSTLSLNAGGTGTFGTVTKNNIICATKPFLARGRQNATDVTAPISFAGTSFVLPTERNTNNLTIVSPFGTATVHVYTGATELGTSPYSVGPTPVTLTANSAANSILVEADLPVLVVHEAAADAIVAYPATTESLFGVPSNYLYTGYLAVGTAGNVMASTGSTYSFSGNRGEMDTVMSSAGTQGTAPAVVVTADNFFAALQEADSDGLEATVFLPEKELGTLYYLPTTAQYIAIACPTVGTSLSLNDGAATATCSGVTVGKALFNAGYTAGVKITGDYPFYLYYEDTVSDGSGDETNVWGVKANRQFTYPEPVVTFGEQTEIISDTSLGSAEGFGLNITNIEKTGGGTLVCSSSASMTTVSSVGMFLDDATGDTLEVVITDPSVVTVATETLYDDATHGDVTPNDGIYTNTNLFSVPALGPGGVWTATVKAGSQADGYDNGYLAFDTESFSVVCSYQPDAQIKLPAEGSYVGDDVYYPTGQERSAVVDNTDTAIFSVQIQNDGVVADNFTITGTATGMAGSGTFTVQYLGTDGVTDVTSQVVGSGYVVSGLAAGSTEAITVKVTPAINVVDGTSYTVTVSARSNTQIAARDDVQAVTTVSAEDDDADGLTNAQEFLLGTSPTNADSDADNIADSEEVDDVNNPRDTDADGIINALDTDSDADGIKDKTEAGDVDLATVAIDTDGDGRADYCDTDSDGDTKTDKAEGGGDTDADGIPNYRDADDTDGPAGDQDLDGLTNADEVILGTAHDKVDSDDDTISDGDEIPDPDSAADTDFDGMINALDQDSDGDTIRDSDEAGDTDLSTPPVDTDEDGIPDYLDTDSDNDGILDFEEAGDILLQTAPADSDGDGIPNFRDTDESTDVLGQEGDSTGDGVTEGNGLDGVVSGGCSLVIARTRHTN